MLEASTWPTPLASDGEKGGQPLPAQMHKAMWGTPREGNGGFGHEKRGPDPMGRLEDQMCGVAMWPTAVSRDGFSAHTLDYVAAKKAQGHGMANLNDYLAATALTGPAPNGSSATTEKRGVPNPVFACWLMGFPDAWISGVLQAMQSFRKSRRKSSAR
jgi:hypothetical protein